MVCVSVSLLVYQQMFTNKCINETTTRPLLPSSSKLHNFPAFAAKLHVQLKFKQTRCFKSV